MLRNKHGRLDSGSVINPEMLIEMQQNTELRRKLGQKFIENWGRTPIGARLYEMAKKDYNRAMRTAFSLQSQATYLKKLKESGTIKSTFHTTPENVLKILRIGVANSNRGSIFTEWQLVTPDDAFFFVDRVYGPNRAGATVAGGLDVGVGQRYGQFGQRIYEGVAPDHGTEQFESERTYTLAPTSTVTVTGTGPTALGPTPLVKMWFKLSIRADGGAYNTAMLVATDDGNGNIVSSYPGISGSLNYETGEYTIELNSTANPNLVGTGRGLVLSYAWDSEVEANYDEQGQVDIMIKKDRFNARLFPIGMRFSRLAELTIRSTGLGNLEDMLIRAMGDEHALRRDYQAVRLAMRLARGNTPVTFDADPTSGGDDNDYNHAQRITAVVDNTGNKIFDELGRGTINTIVAGGDLLTYFKKNRLWKPDKSQPRVGATYLAGYLDDVAVYAIRSAPERGMPNPNQGIMTYKNPDEDGEAAIAFGVVTEFVSALDFPDLYRQGTVATVEDQKPIQPKYLRLLEIENFTP